jgi:hypothetical protein
VVTVGGGPAVSGQMLHDWKDAAGLKALGNRPRNLRYFTRLTPISPITDDRIASGNRNVGNRKAINVDAERPQIGRDKVAGKARCRDAVGWRPVIEFAVPGARRVARPKWRSKPLHAAPFLIHEHGRFPADTIAKSPYKFRDLIRSAHVPLEDDEAPGLRIAQKSALVGGNAKSRQSRDKCACRHRRGLARAQREGQVCPVNSSE